MINTVLTLTDQELQKEICQPNKLRIYPLVGTRDPDGIEILWAPFDYVNRDAKLVIIGVTPGPNQALRSYKAVQSAVARGAEPLTEIEEIKAHSSFRGEIIEPNLKSLLEHSGVAERAGIEDIDDLWTKEAFKIHFTSTIRYPTFINKELFNNQIDSLRHPELRKYIETFLTEELASVPLDAVIVALGKKGPRIARHAAKTAGIDPLRVTALPHHRAARRGRCEISSHKSELEAPGPAVVCSVIGVESLQDGTSLVGIACTT